MIPSDGESRELTEEDSEQDLSSMPDPGVHPSDSSYRYRSSYSSSWDQNTSLGTKSETYGFFDPLFVRGAAVETLQQPNFVEDSPLLLLIELFSILRWLAYSGHCVKMYA
ncbi:hypothetical protein QAD02_007780 [Eretmocerus hayati]|uniref:Uncharacterized protein n=1 Tax=Eretmocerus hayati TaxID=131215 RepID=A0ACC2N5A2_9HYME|nr:hypothetical protein QAD02_007780 [Eretmocerus hayati]